MIRVIISGGGSGGHIFPAIAIANALKTKLKDIDILFVGAKGRMEEKKVPEAGYKIETLCISGLQRTIKLKSFISNLYFPFKLIGSLVKARSILNKFKPDIVVGVGGYASGPVLRAATKMKIPTLILEQNSFPGITNKLLASKVDEICVAYQGMNKFFPEDKIYYTGNPIRQDIINSFNLSKAKALEFFSLSGYKKTLLVIGGSQGARTINESIANSLQLFIDNNIQLIWQTGKGFNDLLITTDVSQWNQQVKILEFIKEMDYAYAAADVVVSRAGAIAISELCAVKKPAILVPSPNVAEDHQTKNASALVNKGAALMIRDDEARKLLGKTIVDLMKNEIMQQELSLNIGALAITDSAVKIAYEIVKLAKKE